MATDRIKYSEAIQSAAALTLNNNDIIVLAQEDSQQETGYVSKATRMATIGEKIVNGIDYTTELQTNSKTIIGAINELEQSGGSTDIVGTASGDILTFTDGGDDIPVKNLEMELTAKQDGTGTPSPSNPRTITGIDEITIRAAGRNLMPSLFGSNTNNGITYTVNEDGTVITTGAVTSGISNRNYGHMVLPAGTYTLSGLPDTLISTTAREAALVLAKDAYSGSQNIIISLYSNISRTATFTLEETTDCYLKIYLYTAAGTMPANTIFKPMVEVGETASEFESFRGTTHTITLPETIYGATINATKGTGTKTVNAVDLGDLTYTYDATFTRMKADITDLKPVGSVRETPFICSIFQSIDDGRAMADVPYDSVYAGAAGTTAIYIKTTETDPAAFKTAVTGQTLVYPIEPAELAFTPEPIRTVEGDNTIYADTGDIDLEYFNSNADQTADLIDAKQETEDYSTEERAIGKWIDGQTLYEKTLFFNNKKLDKSDSTSELIHGVKNIGSVRFVAEAYFKFPNSGQESWSPANNGLWNNGVYNFYWCVGETSIWILSTSGVYFDANPNRSYLVKIRYTKA